MTRVAALLGLDALLQRKPSQLSGGQQQRVALGRAIIAETPVCLMDEPLSNLDAQLRAEMRREIRALQQKLGITMVYVTHDQSEAMSMADRVILMRAGRVEQAAAPEAMYARPASTFAARFIGTPPMNILPVAPEMGGRGGLLFGIRPEHVMLGDTGIASRVQSVEYLGADTIVTCAYGDRTLRRACPAKRRLPPAPRSAFDWRPENLHFFDAASGMRRDDVPGFVTARCERCTGMSRLRRQQCSTR